VAATELVALLQTVGRLTGVHDLFLGETVLAWSASAGDLASNLAVAAAGAPATAFTGCFAGPLFNLMVRRCCVERPFGIPRACEFGTILQ
jgi:sodium/potassium/calcium exchanger 6